MLSSGMWRNIGRVVSAGASSRGLAARAMSTKPAKRVAVTGAAGQIGYSLLFRVRVNLRYRRSLPVNTRFRLRRENCSAPTSLLLFTPLNSKRSVFLGANRCALFS